MRYRAVCLLFIFFLGSVFVSPSALASFTYYRSITVNHTNVSTVNSTTLSSFPVLVNGTYAYLATAANGGKVQNSNGYDIGFYTNSNCSTGKMYWQKQLYTASTGAMTYWVQVSSLSASSDTVFYMCYDDASISTDQSSPSNVWDSNFLGVWHMADNAANTTVLDSTSNGNNGAAAQNTNSLYTTGGSCEFGTCASQNGSSDKVTISSEIPTNPSTITLEGWVNYTYPGCFTCTAGIVTSGSNGFGYELLYDNDNLGYQFISGVYVFPSNVGAAYTLAGIPSGWHFVAGTYDGSAWHIYWDGTLQASLTTASGPASGGGSTVFNSSDVAGYMGETRISSTPRSADWIITEYNNQNAPSSFYTVGSETSGGASSPQFNSSVNGRSIIGGTSIIH